MADSTQQQSSQNSSYSTPGTTTVTNQQDPFQKFLLNLIGQAGSTGAGQISAQTQGAINNFQQNPAIAANYFPQLAAPLLAAARRGETVQQNNLLDTFRKAGGTGGGALQSGAFAQAARNLIADQGVNEQNLLASQYVPLTAQLSNNVESGIKAGLAVPNSTSSYLSALASAAHAVPLAGTTTTSTGYSTSQGSSQGSGSSSSPQPQPQQTAQPSSTPLTDAATYNPYTGYSQNNYAPAPSSTPAYNPVTGQYDFPIYQEPPASYGYPYPEPSSVETAQSYYNPEPDYSNYY